MNADIDIENLKALAAAATPGPWYAADWSDDFGKKLTTIERQVPEDVSDGRSSLWPGQIKRIRIAETDGGDLPIEDAAYIAAANPVAVLALIERIERQADKIAQLTEGANKKPAEPLSEVDELLDTPLSREQAILLAGLQAICISADQEWCRQGGELSEFDKGWFMGQIQTFDLFTSVEKEAVEKCREYIGKLSVAQPVATTAPVDAGELPLTIGDAFKQVGGWMNGGDLGYPTFGSMDALRVYTQKSVQATLAARKSKFVTTSAPDESIDPNEKFHELLYYWSRANRDEKVAKTLAVFIAYINARASIRGSAQIGGMK
jgi:hypothetical protein